MYYQGTGSGTCGLCRTYSTNCNIWQCNVCGRRFLCCTTGGHSQVGSGKCSTCSTCKGDGTVTVACIHGKTKSHTYNETCSECNGIGNLGTTICSHGVGSSHRYCPHYDNTTLTSHSYCSHGRTSQHDD